MVSTNLPSTSGTGTETTGLAVITDREKGVKIQVSMHSCIA
ncbi:iron-containing alcohol dehydrogenase [Sphingobacterium sp. Lzh-3]